MRELADFLQLSGVSIVTIDPAIADRYGILVKMLRKQGTPIPTTTSGLQLLRWKPDRDS